MTVRVLTGLDADEFMRVRLEALTLETRAFGRTPDRAFPWPIETVASRVAAVDEGNFIVGGFQGARMAGLVGFVRNDGFKERHKGHIWGMYVTAAARGQGLAKSMLTLLLDRAREYPDLEQVTLGVTLPQAAARRLYDRLGFEVYGLEPRALRIGEEYVDEELRVLWLRGARAASKATGAS